MTGLSIDRRRLLTAAGVAGAGALLPFGSLLRGAAANAQTAPLGVLFDPAPFTLGVASGDPEAESVILWTRLAPEPLAGDGGDLPGSVDVDWVVATDPRLRRVVAGGTATTTGAAAHSVHVDVRGLEPGSTYFYRFAALGRVSRVGRTRTAPVGSPQRIRFAHISCQNFEAGFYGALRHLAREDLDFVVHLGDYIYEQEGDGEGRSHVGPETSTLEDYRVRHALYKGDPALRAAHAAFPWIVTWDDHEVDDNYAGRQRANSRGPGKESDEAFVGRIANAYQSYFEHMPIRLTEQGPPDGPDFRIYRRLVFGDLLDMSVLDTRQYRTPQPCQVPDGDQGQELFFVAGCPEQDDPGNTIMGAEQRDWLKANLASSTAKWRGIAQQLMVAEWTTASSNVVLGETPVVGTQGRFFSTDQWDGYRVERADLLQHLADREIPDTFVLSGDIHSHWVHDLKPDFGSADSPVVATEFVGTSITSSGFSGLTPLVRDSYYASNPHHRFFEGDRHGYAITEVTPDAVLNTYRVVGTPDTVQGGAGTGRTEPTPPVADLATFRLARGNPLVEQTAGEDGSPRGTRP